MSFSVRYASFSDHAALSELYRTYYPSNHPLFYPVFWQWQFGPATGGQCIVALDGDGKVAGHLGVVPGGGLAWLINILVRRTGDMPGLIAAMFDLARTQGPLAVALANPAGAALLQKRGWHRQPNLRRLIWISPAVQHLPVAAVLAPVALSAGLTRPASGFYQQPLLESAVLPGGDECLLQAAVGGLRLVSFDAVEQSLAWAQANGWRWADAVVSTDEDEQWLLAHGFQYQPDFPWFVNPPDFSRTVELNFFTEEPLPAGFRFSRLYADMSRIGMMPPGA